jgi:putative addiction module killer protein
MTIEILQTETFKAWESGLRDRRIKTIIATRINRLASGLAGDVAPVGEGVSEMWVHYGAGYRIYFQKRGNTLVILLCGGDKSSQSKDIEIAKELAKNWSAT